MSGSNSNSFKMSGSNSNSFKGAGLSDDSWGRVLAVDLLGSSSQDAQEEFSRTETDPQERSRSWLKEAMNLAPKDLARLHERGMACRVRGVESYMRAGFDRQLLLCSCGRALVASGFESRLRAG